MSKANSSNGDGKDVSAVNDKDDRDNRRRGVAAVRLAYVDEIAGMILFVEGLGSAKQAAFRL